MLAGPTSVLDSLSAPPVVYQLQINREQKNLDRRPCQQILTRASATISTVCLQGFSGSLQTYDLRFFWQCGQYRNECPGHGDLITAGRRDRTLPGIVGAARRHPASAP